MSRRILSVAAPLALSYFAPGLGSALGAGLGASGATAGILGNALIGGATGALTGGGLRGALLGAAGGGLGSALGGSSVSGLTNPNNSFGALGNLGGAGSVSGLANPNATGLFAGGGASSFVNRAVNGLSSLNTSRASDDAERQQIRAQQNGLAALQPYAQTGQNANAQLSRLLGLDPNADQNSITQALRNTPGYQFQMEQGTQALDRSASARGGLFSGAAAQELQRFGQGLGDSTYQQALQNLQPSVNTGYGAAGQQAGIFDNIGSIQSNNTNTQSNLLNQGLSSLFGTQQAPAPQGDIDPATGLPRKRL